MFSLFLLTIISLVSAEKTNHLRAINATTIISPSSLTDYTLKCSGDAVVNRIQISAGWGIDAIKFGCSDGTSLGPVSLDTDTLWYDLRCFDFHLIDVYAGGSAGLGKIVPYCKGKTPAPAGLNLGAWTGSRVSTSRYNCPPPTRINGVYGQVAGPFEFNYPKTFIYSMSFYCSEDGPKE